MDDRLVFVIGSPRSGSTLLARMLGAHSEIYARPEPHLLTPLAHLGFYHKVDRAPYDAVLAAESTRAFVADLPKGESDYIDACHAYASLLYERMLSTKEGKRMFLDKTPAYALILDFVARIFPRSKYVVLTRHPLAIFSSYAESFFNSDYRAAHDYNPILERYVPAIARFLRDQPVPMLHIVYEDLVRDPETHLRRIFDFLGLEHEAQAVEYGNSQPQEAGLGDPIGVHKHSRPSTDSLEKWACEIAADAERTALCREIVARLDPADLATWKHPLGDAFWAPLERAGARGSTPSAKRLDRYRLQRMLIVRARALAKRSSLVRRGLSTLRLATDVLLRE